MTRLPWLARLGPASGPALLMLAVALVRLGRPVLSWDEIATADVAARSPGQIWHLIHSIDGVFAPYYFLMHAWTHLIGSSVVDLRLPSVLAMAGTVALAGELGRRLYGPLTGTVAGLLLCLMPNTSRYAAEARPYAFACFFALLALLMLHLAVRDPHPARWSAYGVTVVLLGLSHVIALTTLIAHVVVLWRHRDRRTVLGWSIATALALLALVPIFRLGVQERNAQLAWVTPLTLGGLWNFPGQVVGSVPGGWLLLGLALLALWRPIRHRAQLLTLGLGPIVVVAAVSVLVAPYWVTRYLLVVLPPLALLVAAGLIEPAGPPPPAPAGADDDAAGPAPRARTWDAGASRPGWPVNAGGDPGGSPNNRKPAAAARHSRPVLALLAAAGRVAHPQFRTGPDSAASGPAPVPAGTGPDASRVAPEPRAAAPVAPAAMGAEPGAGRSAVGPEAGRARGEPEVGQARGGPEAGAAPAGPDASSGPGHPEHLLGMRAATVLALLAGAVFPAQLTVRGPNAKNGSDYRTAAAIIRAGQQPGDGIAYSANNRTMRTGVGYYLRGDAGQPRDVLLARSAADVGSLRAKEYPATAGRLLGATRLWLVIYGRRDPLTARKDLRPLLLAHYRRLQQWNLHNATLALYTRHP